MTYLLWELWLVRGVWGFRTWRVFFWAYLPGYNWLRWARHYIYLNLFMLN